jgi:hypothetical protein
MDRGRIGFIIMVEGGSLQCSKISGSGNSDVDFGCPLSTHCEISGCKYQGILKYTP